MTGSNGLKRGLYGGIALMSLSASPAALAQTPAPPQVATPTQPGAQADQSRIDTIVVTARRREEDLQSTPVTLTAFTGDELQEKGIEDFTRLAQVTPGVDSTSSPRVRRAAWFRGVGGGGQAAGGDPSSVAFLDGVYLARPPMLGIDFYDLERIEVLKGPQGTLLGKNVVAGSMNFITAKPVDDFEASMQVTFGRVRPEERQSDVQLRRLADGVQPLVWCWARSPTTVSARRPTASRWTTITS